MSCTPPPTPLDCKRKNYIHWDDYFMAIALLSAKRSKDPITQVGACIVDDQQRIVAIGYNGLPRNCHDDLFPWCKKTDIVSAGNPLNDKKMYVVHAEANAILNKNSVNLIGTKLYSTLFPCNECAKLIIQSGVRTVIFLSDKYADKPIYCASKRMFDAAGVVYTRFIPAQKQVILDFEELIQEDPNSSFGVNDLKIDES